MHKLNNLKWYGEFGSDIWKFETDLRNWIKKSGKNSNLVFDESSLDGLRKALRCQYEKDCSNGMPGIINNSYPERTKYMFVQTIIIEWYAHGEKSILVSVKELDGKVLFQETSSWKDTEIWYAY